MSAENRDAFARDMVELFGERCRGYGTNVDVGHVLRGVLGLVRTHRVRIDANFATLVRVPNRSSSFPIVVLVIVCPSLTTGLAFCALTF